MVNALQSDPSAILQLGFGFFASKTLLSAVELGVFPALANEPRTAADLITTLGLHPRGARDFLDVLVSLNLLARDGDGADAHYANTPDTAAFLVPGRPAYMGGILHMANRRLYPFWARLSEGLRTGRPQNEVADDGADDPFATLYGNDAWLREIVDAMEGVQLADFHRFASQFDFSRYRSVCDIGGSGAALAMAIARQHRHLRCLSLDLPRVTALAHQRIAQAGLGEFVQAVSGNFMTDPFPRSDVLVMSNVLHDWGTADKERLIRKAREALSRGGALVAIEHVIDDERRTNTQAMLMSLNMLIETGSGYNFSHGQFDHWCLDAGFERTECLPLAGASTALIAYA